MWTVNYNQKTMSIYCRVGRNLGSLLVQPLRFKSIITFSPKSLLLTNAVLSDTHYMANLD